MRNFLNNDDIVFYDHIRYHENYHVPENYRLTHHQRQAVIATVLGDGSILYPYRGAKNPRIVWNMGNESHARYKADFFSFLGAELSRKDNPGFGSKWFCVRTAAHPVIKRTHDELYDGSNKNITQKWISELDEVGWAWLYGDDGHLGSNDTCFIHCEGYGKEVAEMYVSALEKFTGCGVVSVHKYNGGTPKKERFCVKFNSEASDKFMERVAPHMATGMEYKISKGNISRRYREN